MPSDPEPQSILAEPARAGVFLVVASAGRPDDDRHLIEVASDVNALVRSVGVRNAGSHLSCVVGIGSDFWDRITPAGLPRPRQLHRLEPIHGSKTAPSTPGDVLFHIRAGEQALAFELTKHIVNALGEGVHILDSVQGFCYFDARNVLGFVDGTENPTGRGAHETAIITDDDPSFAGGSYVIVQKYLHDMAAWDALPVDEQQRVIGRTKLEDLELDDEIRPTNSHVSLNTIEEPDGSEREILRENMPFGDPSSGEFGTYFIGYAADVSTTEEMLRRMFIGEPAGNYDRILDFSTAVTGTLFFVPSLDLLESLPNLTADSDLLVDTDLTTNTNLTANANLTANTDLAIGSLKGQPQ